MLQVLVRMLDGLLKYLDAPPRRVIQEMSEEEYLRPLIHHRRMEMGIHRRMSCDGHISRVDSMIDSR